MAYPTIAVIIPAFKPDFLNSTLQSLVSQTNRDFNIYIGDDCSPSNLESIVSPFQNLLNITYHRFGVNLGGENLVGHWNRCLEMINEEDFFILFSDDDEMDWTCISRLKETIIDTDEDVYRFNLQIISNDGTPIGHPTSFSPLISSMEFFDIVCSSNNAARMPEFVFRTNHFFRSGGFINFKNAIRSDNATVIQCALASGIRTVVGPCVFWRDSGVNISSSFGPRSVERYEVFFSTLVAFFNWMEDICLANDQMMSWSVTRRLDYLLSYGYNLQPVIGTKKALTILQGFKYYPRGIEGMRLWANLILFKIRRKLNRKNN